MLRFAERLERDETNLRDMLSDAERQERGTLRVGGSEMRLNAFLPEVLFEFHANYPKVDVRLTSATSPVLEPLVENGARSTTASSYRSGKTPRLWNGT